MHRHRLADDEAIRDQLADRLARVGVGDLVLFVRVEPDLAFATADHGGGQAFLRAEVDPVVCGKIGEEVSDDIGNLTLTLTQVGVGRESRRGGETD